MLSLGVGLFESAVRAIKGAPAGDTTDPARVTDLVVVGTGPGEAILGWTAAGDDGFSGTAAHWDLRWNTNVITGGNWEASTSELGGWAVNGIAGGTAVERTVLDPGQTPVWYAVRYRDEAGNMGLVSNNVQVIY